MRLPLEEDSLWYRVIKSWYGLKENGWDLGCGSHWERCTSWKLICEDFDVFFFNLRYIVGNGDNIRFGRIFGWKVVPFQQDILASVGCVWERILILVGCSHLKVGISCLELTWMIGK